MHKFFSLLYGLFISPFVNPEPPSLRSTANTSDADGEGVGEWDPNG